MDNVGLLVADGEELVRLGVRSFLKETEVDVVAETATCSGVAEALELHRPRALLLAVRMPDDNGFSVLRQIRKSHVTLPVIMMSHQDHASYFARSHQLGASAFLQKTFDQKTLLSAIRCVASGNMFWTRNHLRRITGVLTTPRLEADIDAPLTPREMDVLRGLASGYTNRGIALDLGISYETVKEHVQHVLAKIGVGNRTQAAIWAVRNELF